VSRILTEELVHLDSKVATKEEAIQAAGELLVQAGRVEAPYVLGMLAREKTMSTLIGNGVAIPHGEFPDLKYIKETSISVLQIPQGVPWEMANWFTLWLESQPPLKNTSVFCRTLPMLLTKLSV
jgi:mannitol/fructose-specific phosphotransferase system IIA component